MSPEDIAKGIAKDAQEHLDGLGVKSFAVKALKVSIDLAGAVASFGWPGCQQENSCELTALLRGWRILRTCRGPAIAIGPFFLRPHLIPNASGWPAPMSGESCSTALPGCGTQSFGPGSLNCGVIGCCG
jgi:hypothetical protein